MYYGFTLAPAYLVTLVFNLNPIFSALFQKVIFKDNKNHIENKLLFPCFCCIGVICISKNKTDNPQYPMIELGIVYSVLSALFTGS